MLQSQGAAEQRWLPILPLHEAARREFRPLLGAGWWLGCPPERLAPPGPAVVLGARASSGDPAGVAVATLQAGKPAMLAWLEVAPEQRGRGLAGQLVAEAGRWVAGRGESTLGAVFIDGKPSSVALRRIFATAGWTSPELSLVQYEADATRFEELVAASEGWLRRTALPAGLAIESWSAVGPAERDALQTRERAGEWPEWLSPFFSRAEVGDADTSLAVREVRGRVAGWLMTRLVAPGAVLHDRLFVDGGLRGRGVSHALVAAALAAQRQRDGAGGRVACRCHASNRPMLAFAERRLAPHASTISRSYYVEKRLR
jgi:GNAT superfamily N-acetyltransferase